MTFTRAGQVVLIIILAAFAGVSSVAIFQYPGEDPGLILARLFALNGFVALCFGAILTAFIKEARAHLGKPFLSLHHTFAAIGLASITLHPLTLAVLFASPFVFIPIVASPLSFAANGGRTALPLILVAVAAVLLRARIPRYWRWIHGLIYPAIVIGLIHGNLVGNNFSQPFVFFTCNVLGILALAAFPFRLYRRNSMKTPKPVGNIQKPP
jgi:DMSO/TMAO reductase YedYZ heme-binding membrane subunit